MNRVLQREPGVDEASRRVLEIAMIHKREGASARWQLLPDPFEFTDKKAGARSGAGTSSNNSSSSSGGGGGSSSSSSSKKLIVQKVNCCAVSPDGQFLAVGNATHLTAWDLRTAWLPMRRFMLNRKELARHAGSLRKEYLSQKASSAGFQSAASISPAVVDGALAATWQLHHLHWLHNSRYCLGSYSHTFYTTHEVAGQVPRVTTDESQAKQSQAQSPRTSASTSSSSTPSSSSATPTAPSSAMHLAVLVVWDVHAPSGMPAAAAVIPTGSVVTHVDQELPGDVSPGLNSQESADATIPDFGREVPLLVLSFAVTPSIALLDLSALNPVQNTHSAVGNHRDPIRWLTAPPEWLYNSDGTVRGAGGSAPTSSYKHSTFASAFFLPKAPSAPETMDSVDKSSGSQLNASKDDGGDASSSPPAKPLEHWNLKSANESSKIVLACQSDGVIYVQDVAVRKTAEQKSSTSLLAVRALTKKRGRKAMPIVNATLTPSRRELVVVSKKIIVVMSLETFEWTRTLEERVANVAWTSACICPWTSVIYGIPSVYGGHQCQENIYFKEKGRLLDYFHGPDRSGSTQLVVHPGRPLLFLVGYSGELHFREVPYRSCWPGVMFDAGFERLEANQVYEEREDEFDQNRVDADKKEKAAARLKLIQDQHAAVQSPVDVWTFDLEFGSPALYTAANVQAVPGSLRRAHHRNVGKSHNNGTSTLLLSLLAICVRVPI